jgi:hypothetical protein
VLVGGDVFVNGDESPLIIQLAVLVNSDEPSFIIELAVLVGGDA